MADIITEQINQKTKAALLRIEFMKFNSAKDGSGSNNFDQMADALENLNMMLAYDCDQLGYKLVTKKISSNIHLYRTIEMNPKYRVRTEDGFVMKRSTEFKMNRMLTNCMTVLWKIAQKGNYL